ncbi:MAG TPA: response regulator transcription factor [Nitrospirae bacterium]|nr:transcriptional regulatory protein ZraR [bacterium BMS3Abin10]GBE39834.1 transcriptional regulatory protein ZraR [bacterium BMS3Bbin08]HDH01445.1 response regulator transcription factor [Nitrospirota bacterium]HDH51118.1 response regulator transcription factor [Nitrospirota bacterium]HDK81831.1 response regulator transcription factor [Nitrospirota bacterium]
MASKMDRILIVDDDRSIHKAMEMMLKDTYDLKFTDDPEKALERIFFNGDVFDLIILDLVMPKMNGIELLKRIREINHWIPVVIITAYSSHEKAKAACNLNVAGYIEKPFDVKEFRDVISNVIWNTEIKGFLPGLTLPNLGLREDLKFFHPVTVKSLYEIHKRFHTDFSIDDIASKCSVSAPHLCKLFKKDCDMTIRDYTNKLRIEVAKRLLRNSAYTVSTIQVSLGYKSRTHFFNVFKEMTGASPLEFRKSSAGDDKKGHA